MLKIKFLGTSAAIPTKDRNTPCIYFEYDYDVRFLMDVGEGCQKSLISNSLKFMRINHVFITHWHADHFAGLIGMIHTMALEGRNKPLHIYGPRRTKEFVDKITTLGYYARKFPVIGKDLKDGDVVEFEHFHIMAFEVEHRIPALGYVFQEKDKIRANMEKAKKFGLRTGPLIGKLKKGETITFKGQLIKPEDVIEVTPGLKVVYTGDTKYSEKIIEYAKDADLLIAESTLDEKDYDESMFHLSNELSAEIAKASNVKKLVLTHISRRYTSKSDLMKSFEEKAKRIFPNVVIAYDGMEITLKK